MWGALSVMPNIDDVDFSRIRSPRQSESVPEPMLKKWQQRSILLQEVYGMTETSGVVYMAQKTDLPEHMYAGHALPYGDVKVMKLKQKRRQASLAKLDARRFGDPWVLNRPMPPRRHLSRTG